MGLQRNLILKAFVKLGEYLTNAPDDLEERLISAKVHNAWFSVESSRQALESIASEYLQADTLSTWLGKYDEKFQERAPFPDSKPALIGVVAAGNIPAVGFHDILCVLLTGNSLLLKVAGKDSILLPYLLDKLVEFEPLLADHIQITERLKEFDAVIATGNNNSARYFKYYFRKVPNIIRKNRNSIAVLTGSETEDELTGLASDVFNYFGLGCRSVSKIYIPEGYALKELSPAFEPYRTIADHNQYRNNLDYHRTVLLMNNIPFEDIDFVNITENPSIASPISNLYYEYYTSTEELSKSILFNRNQIQCIVGKIEGLCTVGFGKTQSPGLSDYADDVDVMEFLLNLKGQ